MSRKWWHPQFITGEGYKPTAINLHMRRNNNKMAAETAFTKRTKLTKPDKLKIPPQSSAVYAHAAASHLLVINLTRLRDKPYCTAAFSQRFKQPWVKILPPWAKLIPRPLSPGFIRSHIDRCIGLWAWMRLHWHNLAQTAVARAILSSATSTILTAP